MLPDTVRNPRMNWTTTKHGCSTLGELGRSVSIQNALQLQYKQQSVWLFLHWIMRSGFQTLYLRCALSPVFVSQWILWFIIALFEAPWIRNTCVQSQADLRASYYGRREWMILGISQSVFLLFNWSTEHFQTISGSSGKEKQSQTYSTLKLTEW